MIQACLCRGNPLALPAWLPPDADLEYVWPGFPGLEVCSFKGCFSSCVAFSLSRLSSPFGDETRSSRGMFSCVVPGDLCFVSCWGLITAPGCSWPVEGMSSSWSPLGGGRSRSMRLISGAAGSGSAGGGGKSSAMFPEFGWLNPNARRSEICNGNTFFMAGVMVVSCNFMPYA